MPHPSSPTAAAASVQVVVRLRPLNTREQQQNTLPVVACNTLEKSVTVLKGTGKHQTKTCYSFDHVFGSFSTQSEVFEETLQPILHDVLLGYESTIFAYGQTGTGKTHTMEGSLEDPDAYGVIPRAAQAIFTKLQKDSSYISHKVYCSLLEIYNEELCDLLVESGKNATKLQIMEGKNGPFCRGLSEVSVESAEELLQLMRSSQQRRQTGETNMNAQSSRSHCIFTLRVEATRQLPEGNTLQVGGKLHCVDLAGSENAAKANMGSDSKQAARELERKNINQSLLTLGRVVSTLKELSQNPKKKSSVRIPYRDSKLTRILQESLGGRCKTCIIATISPSIMAIEETMSTLNYAQAANGIINKPVTTSSMMVGSGSAMSRSASEGDSKEGGGAGSVEHWHEMEVRMQYMQSQVEEAQQALARKHIQHQEIVERAEKAEEDRKAAEAKCQEAMEQVAVLETKVEETTAKLQETETELCQTKMVLGATQETEAKLTREATALIQALQESIANGENIHQDLLKRHQGEVGYKSGTKTYRETAHTLLQDTTNILSTMDELQCTHRSTLSESHSTHATDQLSQLEQQKATVDKLKTDGLEALDRILKNNTEGLFPMLHAFANELRTKLESLSAVNDEASTSLRTSCEAIMLKLDAFDTQFGEFEKKHADECQLLTDAVDKSVNGSRATLAEILSKFEQSMKDSAESRSEARKDVEAIVEEWKSSSLKALNGFKVSSAQLNGDVKRQATELNAQSSIRDRITSLMKSQTDAILEQKDIIIGKLQSQNEDLKKQNEALKNAETEQEQRNEAMVKNVMNGMQELLQKEMAGMTKFQEETFASFASQNDKARHDNTSFAGAVDANFDGMHKTNASIQKDIANNFALQESVSAELESEADSFNTLIQKDVEAAENKVSRCAVDVKACLSASGEDDVTNTDALTKQTSEQVRTHFTTSFDTVQDNVSSNLESLGTHVSSFGKQVKDGMMAPVRTYISDDLLSNQEEIAKSVKSALTEAEARVSRSENDLTVATQKNVAVAENLQSTVVTSTQDIVAQIETLKTGIEAHKSSTDKTLNDFQTSAADNITEAKAKIGSSSKELNSFAHNVIRYEEAPEEVAERAAPAFSTELSSTPDESFILQGTTVTVNKSDAKPKKVLQNRTVNVSEDSPSPSGSTTKRPADRSMYSSRLGKRAKG